MTVKGLVKDTTGEPIIGANVVVKGTTNGTITDFDGNFLLNANKGDIIVISFIGYLTQELPAATSLNVILKDDTETLEEVVVIGYGVAKKNDLTGSVTAMKPDGKNKGLVINAQDMISGKIAGVNVTSNDGAPGSGAQIRIRGGSSLNASNDPLIVIDGMAMDNEGVKGLSNKLAMINPQNLVTLAKIPTKRTKIIKHLLYMPILGTFIYNMKVNKRTIMQNYSSAYLYDPNEICERDILTCFEASHREKTHSKYLYACQKSRYLNTTVMCCLNKLNNSIFIIAGNSNPENMLIAEQYQNQLPSIEIVGINNTKMLPHVEKAEEFIDDQEILDTIEYAKKNKNNRELIFSLIERAKDCKGLTHREAMLLLECDIPEAISEMEKVAKMIKDKLYGNRIVLFAPLYLSNYCINGCVYCPYHQKNKHIARKKLTQEEIKKEVIALQDMGHKRLALETGEDPINNPIEYVLESIKTIYSIKHKNGAIRRVNVNIAATTVENYRKLKEAGIGTYILFQETYNKKNYEALHPTGPKHNYAYHTEAMDRAMEGGIDDVGIGVLFGLEMYRYDFVGLLMHAEHLEAVHGVGPHTISVPRICPADDIDKNDFTNAISDEIFEKIVMVIRMAVPYTGMIISTRESKRVRERVLELGVSQISGGSKTSVGGYEKPEREDETTSAQFDTSDKRSLDEIVNWLCSLNFIPSFCTACYREGRTGDRFMQLCKSGQISNCCHPNALLTLKEYIQNEG